MEEKKYIIINNKKIPIEPKTFNDEDFLDRDIMRENCLIIRDCFEKNNLFYGLIYGTLLGAIREKNFIEYDHDADIYLLHEDKEKFLQIVLDCFLKRGFKVIREGRNTISLIRKENYIDFYFFEKKDIRKKHYRFMGPAKYPAKILEESMYYLFLGKSFRIPKHYLSFLEISYGKDWKTPKKNFPPQAYRNNLHGVLSKTLRNFFPSRSKGREFLKTLKNKYKFLNIFRI